MGKKGIILVGPYHAGKTTCSKVISSTCGWDRYDLDDMYTETFGESIWATRNLKGDKDTADKRRDQIGLRIISRIKDAERPSIAVFGGGSFFESHPGLAKKAKSNHLVVYLRPSRQTLVKRALDDKEFGASQFLFRDATPAYVDRYFEQLLLNKGQGYLKLADRMIEPQPDWSVNEVCFHILSCYLQANS